MIRCPTSSTRVDKEALVNVCMHSINDEYNVFPRTSRSLPFQNWWKLPSGWTNQWEGLLSRVKYFPQRDHLPKENIRLQPSKETRRQGPRARRDQPRGPRSESSDREGRHILLLPTRYKPTNWSKGSLDAEADFMMLPPCTMTMTCRPPNHPLLIALYNSKSEWGRV